jgi:hypothetical protein
MLFTQAGTLPPLPDALVPNAPEDAGAAAFSACAGRCPGSSATAAPAIVERLMNCLRFMVSSFVCFLTFFHNSSFKLRIDKIKDLDLLF